MSALVSTVMMATLVVGPFHLAGGWGSRRPVGLAMSVGPGHGAGRGAGRPAGRQVRRGRLTVAGLGAMAAGCGLALVPARLGVAGTSGR